MTNAENTPDKKKSHTVNTALNVAAYGVATVAAVPVANQTIQVAIYEQNKGFEAIKKARKQRDEDRDNAGIKNKDIPHASAKARAKVQADYETEVAGILKDQLGIEGTRDYWRELTKSNRWKVTERAGTVFGIVLTALLTVVNIEGVGKILSHKHKHPNESNER